MVGFYVALKPAATGEVPSSAAEVSYKLTSVLGVLTSILSHPLWQRGGVAMGDV